MKRSAPQAALAVIAGVLISLLHPAAASAQDSPPPGGRDFESALRAATGPHELRALEIWCMKEGLKGQADRVGKILKQLRPPARFTGQDRKREAGRLQRAEAAQAVRTFMERERKSLAALLPELLTWMKERRYAPADIRSDLAHTVRIVIGATPDGSRLSYELANISHESRPPKEEATLAKSLRAERTRVFKRFTTRLFGAIDRCLKAREAGLAFDLYQFLLRVDPDNSRAHRAIGEVRVGERWLRPYEALQWRRGLTWDTRLGWILEKGRGEYDKGRYFDLQSKRWWPLSELNALRAKPRTPWKLESEHFELISTADLEISVQVLARLEAFFLQAFRQYDLFFAGRSPNQSAKLIFGVLPTKTRLRVFFYRDREQFLQEAKPPVDWAGGFYDGGRRASFFYAEGGSFHVEILQHELTHQILAQFSAGQAPAWIAEGATVFLEYSYFDGPTLTPGGPLRNQRVQQYASGLRGGMEHSLKDVLVFKTLEDWKVGDISRNYRGVGAVISFLMHFDGGRYRADTLAMIRDSYGGNTRPIQGYYGLSLESLELLMKRFYTDCDLSGVGRPPVTGTR